MSRIDYLPTYFSDESSSELSEDETPKEKYCNVKVFYETNRIAPDVDFYRCPSYESAVKFSENVRKYGFMNKKVSGVSITLVY